MKMKNNLYYTFCALLLAALWLLAGCSSSEEWSPQPVSGDLYITIDPSTYASSNDLNACESRIEKLRVFVFNSDGSFDNMISTTTLPVKVRVSAGTNKRVIAVANEPAAAAGYLAAANTVNGVQQVMYDLSDYLPIEMGSSDALYYGNLGTNVTAASTGYTLPMYGEATGVNVTYANTEGSPMGVSVALSRCVARIDIYIRKKAGVGVVGKLLPASTRLGVLKYPGNILNRPTGGGGYYPYPYESPAYGAGFLAPDHIALYDSGACSGQLEFMADAQTIPVATGVTDRSDYKLCYSFYVPETDYSVGGMLRPVLWGFDWNGRSQSYFPLGIGEIFSPGGGPITQTLNKLSRNTVYRLFWTLAPDREDVVTELQVCPWEVEPIQPAPTGDLHITNCYIVQPGGKVHIPVREVFDIYRMRPELGGPLSPTEPLSVTVVWHGAWNDCATPTLVGTGEDAYIEVQAKDNWPSMHQDYPYEDNATVALKVGTDIVWSFHIWVTSYNPNHPKNQRTSAAAPGVVMMDRYLGEAARSNHLIYPQYGNGLSYQWGRKDPFGVSNLGGAYSGAPMYCAPGGDRFVDEFRSPDIIFNDRGLHYTEKGISKTVDAASLWYGENGRKTIYDPCPEGWKVMPKTVFDVTSATANFTFHPDSGNGYGPKNDSFYRHADWGDFSTAGCCSNPPAGSWTPYGVESLQWMTSPSTGAGVPQNSIWNVLGSTPVVSTSATPSSLGVTCMVRCVKE